MEDNVTRLDAEGVLRRAIEARQRTTADHSTPSDLSAPAPKRREILNWADDVEEAILRGELYHADSVDASAPMVQRLDIELQARDAVSRRTKAAGLGTTSILRGPAGAEALAQGSATDQALQHICGLPSGTGVTSSTWTDADIRGYATEAQLDKIEKAIWSALDKSVGRAQLPSGCSLDVCEYSEQNLFIPASRTGRWYACYVRPEVLVLVYARGRYVHDVAVNTHLTRLREHDTTAYRDVLAVLAAIQVGVVYGRFICPFVLLQDAAIKDILKSAQRSGHSSIVRPDHYFGGGPLQVADSHGSLTHDQALGRDRRSPVTFWHPDGVAAQGVVGVADVPASLVVGLGANGGKALTASTVAVRVAGTGEVCLVSTTATANAPLDMLRTAIKTPPCVRDGLYSPACTAALYGDGAGSVYVSVDGKRIGVETCLTLLRPGVEVVVRGRDTLSLAQMLLGLVALQQWTSEIGGGGEIHVTKGGEPWGTLKVRPGVDLLPRWAAALRTPAAIRGHASELWMDHGCSGLGRYLMQDYIKHGRFVGFQQFRVNKRGPFREAVRETLQQKVQRPHGGITLPVSFVLDTEFFSRRTTTGHVERYVYAVGVARFYAGEYQGSLTVVDNSPELGTFMETNGSAVRRYKDNWQTLVDGGCPQGNPADVLAKLRELSDLPGVRIFAKGADAEAEILASDVDGATRLFRRQGKLRAPVRELGHVAAKYEEYARGADWDETHDPGREAVLFGYACGLCERLPDPSEIGGDPARLLLWGPEAADV
ncbi:hypothetical protein KM761_s3gp1 [Betachrysovirus aspergilli]|uniref:Uncharacterized protein n=1 Tax=Betachrysovirus aspergilli TaxID=2164061 RepID=A0A3S7J343_9VIRU|nr:hypothetical protein KM761_s3gp1 [Betachrysovirus aspergilli]AWC67509.1 hypothetical protein [Betachrysovirus aspergilli]